MHLLAKASKVVDKPSKVETDIASCIASHELSYQIWSTVLLLQLHNVRLTINNLSSVTGTCLAVS